MKTNQLVKPMLRRLVWIVAISIGLVLGVSEVAYQIQRGGARREPTTIELEIPAGTGDQIAAGESPATIPADMVFITGDTLVVVNNDNVTHLLGPLWIPAGARASLRLDKADDYAYSCSFQSSKVMGLTVRQAVTWASRLQALGYGVPPTVMFLLVYSLVMRPIKVNETGIELVEA